MNKTANLFLTFAKIGCMSFGGGYAMLPILQRELVEKQGWISDEELTDCFAMGQCTPGVIAVNTATFVGYKMGGILGAAAATTGVVVPSLIIITILAAFLSGFQNYPAVKNAFAGIRAVVCALIANAVIKLWKSAIVDKTGLIIFAVIFAISIFTDISAVLIVIGAGAAGMIIGLIRKEASK